MKKIVLFILLLSSYFTRGQLIVTEVSHIDTAFRQVCMNGPLLCGINYASNGLTIYNLDSDSLIIPSFISTVSLSDSALSLCTLNSFLAVGGSSKLMIVDMTYPDSALEVSDVSASGAIQGVAFYNEIYASMKNGANAYTLLRVNVDDPYTPYAMDSLEYNFPIGQMAIYNNYGYLLETQVSTSILHIFNLDNDTTLLSEVAADSLPLNIKIDAKAGSLFIGGSDSISVYSLANPVSPQYMHAFLNASGFSFAGITANQCAVLDTTSCRILADDAGIFNDTSFAGNAASISISASDNLVFYSTTTTLYILQIQDITGLKEIPNKSFVHVYPNPSQGPVNFDLSSLPGKKYSLSIFNQAGQLVLKRNNLRNEVYTMNDDLCAGSYIYLLTDGTKIIGNGKIVIEH